MFWLHKIIMCYIICSINWRQICHLVCILYCANFLQVLELRVEEMCLIYCPKSQLVAFLWDSQWKLRGKGNICRGDVICLQTYFW